MRIIKPNYTISPNDLYDHWIPLLKEAELKVLLIIIRLTFGWHKERDKISISQMMRKTGLSRPAVTKATKSLQAKGLIIKITTGKKGKEESYYELMVYDAENEPPTPVNDVNPPQLTELTPPPVKIINPQKKLSSSKESLQKKYIPSADALEILNEFANHLKKLKPDFKFPHGDAWPKVFDEMLSKDNRSKPEVVVLIAWLSSNEFWRTVILSPKKFREKFDQLCIVRSAEKDTNKHSGLPYDERNKKKVLSRFKHGGKYAGCEFNVTQDRLAFQRGMNYRELAFKEANFDHRLEEILKYFGIA